MQSFEIPDGLLSMRNRGTSDQPRRGHPAEGEDVVNPRRRTEGCFWGCGESQRLGKCIREVSTRSTFHQATQIYGLFGPFSHYAVQQSLCLLECGSTGNDGCQGPGLSGCDTRLPSLADIDQRDTALIRCRAARSTSSTKSDTGQCGASSASGV